MVGGEDLFLQTGGRRVFDDSFHHYITEVLPMAMMASSDLFCANPAGLLHSARRSHAALHEKDVITRKAPTAS